MHHHITISDDEEITEYDLFMSLNETDFARLKLTTKLIKTIQKIQKCVSDDQVIEEYLENSADNTEAALEADEPTPGSSSSHDPYHGMSLEHEIHVDTIFAKTNQGTRIIEVLKENKSPDDKTIKLITHLLCDFLKSLFGVRVTSFHKNLLAISLVQSYPILKSANSEVPQALWYYQNARGEGAHAGKLHYRMEYLAKLSGERIIKRRAKQESQAESKDEEPDASIVDEDALVEEFQFIVPSPENKNRITFLWESTFKNRNKYRMNGQFYKYLEDFPAASAYDGELIDNDFRKIKKPKADFLDQWQMWQAKVLTVHQYLFKEIADEFFRTLAIIRTKNPTRGSKRMREEAAAMDNPLNGVVQWICVDDPLPTSNLIPVLSIRGELLQRGGQCFISWKEVNIPVGSDVTTSFLRFCECFDVFGIKCMPNDKQFFMFLKAVMLSAENLSTTGEKFVRSLQ
ncbi:uncharacterized protein LOC131676086 [Topomyia yanbarensis]|uniref:uncharacterized protein LOC131676086 n=1 Tax=Topomyia yanbarensis TaxID=2498891 RepID=UPI00273B0FA9|nr:uncharacterized protein LOC131676086 [Topomyia yanbarensis]